VINVVPSEYSKVNVPSPLFVVPVMPTPSLPAGPGVPLPAPSAPAGP